MILKPPKGRLLNRSHLLSKGLVGCWLMNEGGGNTVQDLSGYGHIGTFAAGAAAPTWAAGKFGSSLEFASGDYVSLANNYTGPFTGVTASGWIKSTATTTQTILDWRDGVGLNDGVWFAVDLSSSGGNVVLFYTKIGTHTSGIFGTAANDNQWHHVAATGDQSFIRYYFDGIEVGTPDAGSGDYTPTESVSRIGLTNQDSNPCIGSIDMITLYDRALSPSEIQQIYRDPFCMFEVML